MIASHVRFALSPATDIVGALSVFLVGAEELPLAWRPHASPPLWAGECMAGEMHKSLSGDLSAWPRRLRGAVRAAIDAARESLAAGRPKHMQAAAYASAFAQLFDPDVRTPVQARLARQLAVPIDDLVVEAIMDGTPQLGARAALLSVRGAANAVATGARLQIPDAQCAFCHDGADSMSHYMSCHVALSAFCGALQCPVQPHLVHVLRTFPAPASRLWAVFVDLASVTCASRSDVVARMPAFVATAASALARVHVTNPAMAEAAQARRAPPRRPPRAPPRSCVALHPRSLAPLLSTCKNGQRECAQRALRRFANEQLY